MPLFEDAMAIAREAKSTHVGPDWETHVRAEIARLEEEAGEKLLPADVALILTAGFKR